MKITSPIDNGCSPEGAEPRHPSRPSRRSSRDSRTNSQPRPPRTPRPASSWQEDARERAAPLPLPRLRLQYTVRSEAEGVSNASPATRTTGEKSEEDAMTRDTKLFTHRYLSIQRGHRPSSLMLSAIGSGSQLPVLSTPLSKHRKSARTPHFETVNRVGQDDFRSSARVSLPHQDMIEEGLPDLGPTMTGQLTASPCHNELEAGHITHLSQSEWLRRAANHRQGTADLLLQAQMMSGARPRINTPKTARSAAPPTAEYMSAGFAGFRLILNPQSSPFVIRGGPALKNLEEELRALQSSSLVSSQTSSSPGTVSEQNISSDHPLSLASEEEISLQFGSDLSAAIGLFVHELRSNQARSGEASDNVTAQRQEALAILESRDLVRSNTSWSTTSTASGRIGILPSVSDTESLAHRMSQLGADNSTPQHVSKESVPPVSATSTSAKTSPLTSTSAHPAPTHEPSPAQKQAMLQQLIAQEVHSLVRLVHTHVANTSALQASHAQQAALSALHQAACAHLALVLARQLHAAAGRRGDAARADTARRHWLRARDRMLHCAKEVEAVCTARMHAGCAEADEVPEWVEECAMAARYYAGVGAMLAGQLGRARELFARCAAGKRGHGQVVEAARAAMVVRSGVERLAEELCIDVASTRNLAEV